MSVAAKHSLRVVTVLTLIVCCVLVLRVGTPANFVLVHAFYLPILLGAFWFKVPGGGIAGLTAGIATNPYLVGSATPSEYMVDAWIVRVLFFVAFGLAMGAICNLLALRQERVESNVQELARIYARTLKSLVFLLEHHDEETLAHCERVAANALRLGKELHLSQVDLELLYWSAYLHDIGKLASPARMLLKEGPLTDEEYEVMKKHASIGAEALSHISRDFLPVAEAVLTHHERWDGTGYPNGVEGEQIPLFGRILAVVDSFEAMTSDRPYRKAMSSQAAARILEQEAGKQFDPHLVNVYLKLIEQHHVHMEQEDGARTGLGFPLEFNISRIYGAPRTLPWWRWGWRSAARQASRSGIVDASQAGHG